MAQHITKIDSEAKHHTFCALGLVKHIISGVPRRVNSRTLTTACGASALGKGSGGSPLAGCAMSLPGLVHPAPPASKVAPAASAKHAGNRTHMLRFLGMCGRAALRNCIEHRPAGRKTGPKSEGGFVQHLPGMGLTRLGVGRTLVPPALFYAHIRLHGVK